MLLNRRFTYHRPSASLSLFSITKVLSTAFAVVALGFSGCNSKGGDSGSKSAAPGSSGGKSRPVVVTQESDSSSSSDPLLAPMVTEISPSSGPISGGTEIVIAGTNLEDVESVLVGGQACDDLVIASDYEISCTVAAHSAGAVIVLVTSPTRGSTSVSGGFTYVGAPVVSSAYPSGGGTGGGTSITISGSGFSSGATVTVGGVACTLPSVVSATTITCTTGAHAAGATDVVVTNSDTQSGTGSSAFTYRAAPTVTSVNPTGGTLSGGTSLTITGTGFVSGATVSVGSVSCTSANVVSSTSITCTTGARTGGSVDVIVTNSDTQSGTGAGLYTYRPDAPTSLTLSSPSTTPNNDASPTVHVSGGGVANGRIVKLYRDSSCLYLVGSAVAGVTDEADVTASPDLSDNSYTFYATASSGGAESPCSTANVAYTLDTVNPGAPTISLNAGDHTPGVNASPSFDIVRAAGGNFTNNDTIRLYEGGNNTCNGTLRKTQSITDNSTSSVTLSTDTALSAYTSYTFYAKVTDQAGNSTCSTLGNTYVYRAAPTVTISSPAAYPAAGGYAYSSNASSFTVSGTCSEDGRTVSISGYTTASPTCSSGTWSTNLDLSGGGFAQGAFTLYADHNDAVGNTATQASRGFYKDTVAPTVAFTSPSNNSYIIPSNQSSYTVSGTCSENSQTVSISGSTTASTSCSSGTWTTNLDLSALSEGAVTLYVNHTDAAGNTATQGQLDLTKDTAGPTVSSVTSNTVDGIYRVGKSIDIRINFNEIVTVTGTPYITLETGSTDRNATYASGSGSTTLVFTYTVQSGDTSSDLNYNSTSALALNSGTIKDNATNNATLTLPALASGYSLAGGKALFINPNVPITQLVNGSYHACLVANGAVKCWGDNTYGKLGDNTTTSRISPVQVSGLTSGVLSIALGGHHTCAMLSNGSVKCWGLNGNGQLGNNSISNSYVPTAVYGVSAGSGVQAISAGEKHTCMIVRGAVKCWGYNSNGQLGDATTTERSIPTAAAVITSGAQAISASTTWTCAIHNGAAKCWGEGGKVGDSTSTQRPSPTAVTGLTSGVTAITSGPSYQTCAIQNGAAKCWGSNGYGQLGDNTYTDRTAPVQVTGLTSGAQALAMNALSACAIVNGGMKCWGYNSQGQLGDNTTTFRATPATVTGIASGAQPISGMQNLSTTRSPSGGYGSTLAIVDGSLKSWGLNGYYQLGDGTSTDRTTPITIANYDSGTTTIAAGQYHACAVVGGAAKCWGKNTYGQLGDNTTTDRTSPTAVTGLTSGVQYVVTGGNHSCAIVNGGIKCWGDNSVGQLGDNTTTQRNAPVDALGLTADVIGISVGEYHTCAIVSGGAAKCWGKNTYGQIGDNTTTQRNSPTAVNGLTSAVQAITAGQNHSCAIITGGAMRCWGRNNVGQIGDNTTTQRNTPTQPLNLSAGIQSIAAGYNHTCASVNGTPKCWGDNTNGQLGDNTTTQRNSPVSSGGGNITGVIAISAGADHTCVNDDYYGLSCWGSNSDGQGGGGGSSVNPLPVAVTTGGAAVTSISCGSQFTCGILDSTPKCWGNNASGQIGDGTTSDASTPTTVSGI